MRALNVTEKFMCQQMTLLASGMGVPPTGEGKDGGGASFQDMIEKVNEKVESGKETPEKPEEKNEPQDVQEDKAPAEGKDEEELKAENLTANPNAASYIDLFRPEITPVEEEAAPVVVEAAVEVSPEEPEAAVELPETVETAETAEPVQEMPEAPKAEFQQVLAETPKQEAEAPVEQDVQPVETEQPVEVVEAKEETPEVEVEVRNEDDSDEPKAEAAEVETPVFHDVKAAPVKVGETYESVDTQEPEMDEKLANTIQQALQNGSERVEIRLTPENLGTLTIEMTKDVNGALQVVLHAANSRAAGLLSQHMDGLHAALQSYSQEPVQIEVQRGEESQQQNLQQQADPDGRGQNRQQRERHEEEHNAGGDFLQKMRLGLFGSDDTL